MTTRDQVTKWLVYALALLPLCLLDQYVLGRLTPFGAAPLLYPLAAVAVGMMEGPFPGACYGLAAGVMAWLGSGGVAAPLVLTVAGLLAGLAVRQGLSLNLGSYLLTAATLLLVGDGGRVLFYLLRGWAQLSALLRAAGAESLCTLVFAVPVYGLYRAVWRQVGGTRLA